MAITYKRCGNKKIEIVSGTEHGGPDIEEQYNSLVHEIGCCVREKVPMIAANYADLDTQSTWEVIYNYLSVCRS